jgi:hexosaminidase
MMMKKIFFSFSLLLGMVAVRLPAQETEASYPIIPRPVSVTALPGSFSFKKPATIKLCPSTPQTKELAAYIADFLPGPARPKVTRGRGDINVIIEKELGLPSEGYVLSIMPEAITIRSSSVAGAFWGFQTLRQLMPACVEMHQYPESGQLSVPCSVIVDFPRFSWRGLHLDVSRHLFSVEFIKKYIDTLSFYKLNTFHWHLTDDQGWRIEIKKFPALQKKAAFRDETVIGHLNSLPQVFDGKRYGGYYTQEQVKEIVRYAQKRHVTIIPEIEIPGHSLAALTAYPSLGCTGGPYVTATKWGIFDDIYCAGKEETFEFLEAVLSEVMRLFPSRYIHIGGDEVITTRWKNCEKCQRRMLQEGLEREEELQGFFLRRIAKFVNKKGRKIIGWDEILDGAAPNAAVMVWRDREKSVAAVRRHHKVVMCPCEYLYFDFYQSSAPSEPLAIGGYTPLEKVYLYEPVAEDLTEVERSSILGAQANVWTEYMLSEHQVEYMTYPRAIALAEVVWSPSADKDFKRFLTRLKANLPHLKAMGIQSSDHMESLNPS